MAILLHVQGLLVDQQMLFSTLLRVWLANAVCSLWPCRVQSTTSGIRTARNTFGSATLRMLLCSSMEIVNRQNAYRRLPPWSTALPARAVLLS
jgi:hypothetical protein